MDPLLQDSYEVESWEELFKYAVCTGRKEEFLIKFSDYINATNQITQMQLDRYIKKRRAEMKAEDEKNKQR